MVFGKVAWGFLFAVLAATIVTSRGMALELLFSREVRGGMPYYADASRFDFDGDGAAELVIGMNNWPFSGDVSADAGVYDTFGNLIWRIEDPHVLCPTCPPASAVPYELWGFGDVDPVSGREAVLKWRCETTGEWGISVVSCESGALLATIPAVQVDEIRALGDYGGSKYDEFSVTRHLGDWMYRVSIWGCPDPDTSDSPETAASNGRVSLRGNPSAEVSAVLTLTSPRHVSARIYDASGRVVRDFDTGGSISQEHTFMWDSRDDTGSLVPSGTYFLRIESDRDTHNAKLVVIR